MSADTRDYNPFALDDPWARSTFATFDSAPQSLFPILDVTLSELTLPESSFLFNACDLEQLARLELNDSTHGRLEQFEIPVQNGEEENRPDTFTSTEDRLNHDIWKVDLQEIQGEAAPRLRTWDAFVKNEDPTSITTPYISEAGPAIWDAVLAEGETNASDIVEPALFLKSLALLGQGRSSVLFRSKDPGGKLEARYDSFRTSGISHECAQSFVEHFTSVGLNFISLERFVQNSYTARRPSSTRISLSGCIKDVIANLDSHLSRSLRNVKSLVQLQAIFKGPYRLTTALLELAQVCRTESDQTDLLALHLKLLDFKKSSVPFITTLNTIVARTSQPWLQSLCEDIGLQPCTPARTNTIQIPESDSGSTSFDEGHHQSSKLSTNLASFFLSERERQSATEIITGLDIIRNTNASHPLSQRQNMSSAQVLSQDCSADDILLQAQKYEADVMAALRDIRIGSPERTENENPMLVLPIEYAEQAVWRDDIRQQDFFATVTASFDRTPGHDGVSAAGGNNVMVALNQDMWNLSALNDAHETSDLDSSQDDILSTFRPLIATQSRLVNGSVLRLMFRDCGFRAHLELQYNFHLLGNGQFLERLGDALFSSSSSSAERKRETVPASHNLGLRLNAREGQRWPPASSELRLTLAGILSDSYHGEDRKISGNDKDLPGGLSFAIRELSDAEIDSVIDTTSIHALDFLRLQYTPPESLKPVIGEGTLKKYDEIFRFLLQLVRVSHLITDLKVAQLDSRSPSGTKPKDIEASRFIFTAYHIIFTIMSHISHLCISAPWHSFMSRLDSLEDCLAAEDQAGIYGSRTSIGLHDLARMHDQALDTIRTRLFLRRKQATIKSAVEDIMAIILKAAANLRDRRNGPRSNPSTDDKAEHGIAGNDRPADLALLHEEMNASCSRLIALLETMAAKKNSEYDAATAADFESFGLLARTLDGDGYFTEEQGNLTET